MAESEKKDSVGMDMVYQTIEANITNPVGVYLLPSYAGAFELDKQKALVEDVYKRQRYGKDSEYFRNSPYFGFYRI